MGEIILIILLLYLLIQVVSGYRKGFLHAALTLAAWILTFAIAYYAADYFKAPVAQYIMRQPQNFLTDQIAYVIAFILVTIVVRIIFSFVIRFINKINNLPGIGFIRRRSRICKGIIGDHVCMLLYIFDAGDRIKQSVFTGRKTRRNYGNACGKQSVHSDAGKQHRSESIKIY